MKGFVRILESIIASIIILTSLTFFFNITIKPSNWEDVFLQVRAEDILSILERNGTIYQAVKYNNPSLIDVILANQNLSFLPFTSDYSFEVRGIPNPIIYVGCDCSSSEINNLTQMLSPLTFNYKDRQLQIRIDSASLNNIKKETNVLFFFGYHNLNTSKANMNNFLQAGGTLFMLTDLTRQQVEDGIMNETFGLKWGMTGDNGGSFYGSDNENTTSFRIYKYYKNLTGGEGPFTFSSGSSIAVDNRTVVEGNGASLVKVNKEIVNGNGRTVWFDNYASSQVNNLTKATILWASGEKFRLDSKSKNILPHHVVSRVFVYDSDVYEIVLTLWNVLNQG
ncbi:MAG: hypothetical protein NT120_01525 [Candidatus Aenigmarchaeota archaeon]|nr:hypothetical protein [Candidatus Aenigmarchaeota archaeon]